MSTNSECLFVEKEPGRWYYILGAVDGEAISRGVAASQGAARSTLEHPAKLCDAERHRDAPKDAFSWLDYATAYGPFADENQTAFHLRENHPNPGGYSVIRYGSDMDVSPSATKLIAECDTKRMTPRESVWRGAAPRRTVTRVNGHNVMRPSGPPRLMPQTTQRGRAPRLMPTTTKRYTVVLVETITREAVMDIDILPNQDNRDAEQIALERLANGYDIQWSEPEKKVRAMGTIK